MKNIIYSLLLGAAVFNFASCMEVDNFDEPAARIHGTIIDDYTGKPFDGCTGDNHIKIWERSFSLNPGEQGLHIKGDGTYNNDKLFNGTYWMCPVDGPWFPCDTIKDVAIGKKNNSTQDFHVMPYLAFEDFDIELIHVDKKDALDTLVYRGRLLATHPEGYNGHPMPNVRECRPFINNIHHCGGSGNMGYYYTDDYRINYRKSWDKIEGKSDIVEFRLPVKHGYHYWCRLGANVMDNFNHWNYSEVKEIVVPNDPE